MDCDTTGVEPDFALVKFKKLSGGGYFKIINHSIPTALLNLGYTQEETDAIVNYAKGHATFKGAPHINEETLLAKGFEASDIEVLNKAVESAFEINFVFNVHTLGEDCMKRLGFAPEQYNNLGFNVLEGLGFTAREISEVNDYVCGTMTVEGAPLLKEEHLPVFDCANKCGAKGQRYIHSHGHIRMMGAVQPFISGAISKTINLPHEATVDEIKDCYELSWTLGLKANALYRDGCKLSQPLSNKASTKETDSEETKEINVAELTAEQVLEGAMKIIQDSTDTKFKRQLSNVVHRKKLPSKRLGFTQKAKVGGQTVFIRTGEYGDGTLGEIFIDMHKEGASYRSLVNCFSIAISIGLQYGVPLEEFADKFVFTRFEPSGMVDHPNIKSATSIVDYIFRLLGFEYLQRDDLVQVKPNRRVEATPPKADKEEKSTTQAVVPNVVESPVPSSVTANGTETTGKKDASQDHLSSMMGDAPACDVCGHITVRSGTCYKCLNCGNSLGCS